MRGIRRKPARLCVSELCYRRMADPRTFTKLHTHKIGIFHPSRMCYVPSRGAPARSRSGPVRSPISGARMSALTGGTGSFNLTRFNVVSGEGNVVRMMNPREKLALPKVAVIYNSSRASARNTVKTITFNVKADRMRVILTSRYVLRSHPGAVHVAVSNRLNGKIATGSVTLCVVSGVAADNTAKFFIRCTNSTIHGLDVRNHLALYGLDVRVKTHNNVITPSRIAFRCVGNERRTPGNIS